MRCRSCGDKTLDLSSRCNNLEYGLPISMLISAAGRECECDLVGKTEARGPYHGGGSLNSTNWFVGRFGAPTGSTWFGVRRTWKLHERSISSQVTFELVTSIGNRDGRELDKIGLDKGREPLVSACISETPAGTSEGRH
jgi:hypothetical protein